MTASSSRLPRSIAVLRHRDFALVQVGNAQVPVRPLFDALMSLDKLKSVHDIPGLGK